MRRCILEVNTEELHCVKSVSIRSYSGLHFPAFGQNNSEYGHFLRSGRVVIVIVCHFNDPAIMDIIFRNFATF